VLSVSNSELPEDCQSQPLLTAQITQEPRICSSLQSRESEAVSTDYPLALSEMFVSAQLKRVCKNSERKFIQLSSSDKEEPGEDLTVLSSTVRTTLESLSTTKEKPRVQPSPALSQKKPPSCGLRLALMLVPSSDFDIFNIDIVSQSNIKFLMDAVLDGILKDAFG